MRVISSQALLLALPLAVLPVVSSAQASSSDPADRTETTGASDKPAAADKPAATEAASGDYWRLMASPYTVHYHQDDNGDHRPVYMFGLERQLSSGWVWGGTYFSNSFGQPSAYVYVGEKVMNFSSLDKLFFQWTAGVLYGYKYPFEDKVPFNYHGFAPGVTVSLGWQFTREFSMQAIALGAAGVMFQLAIDLR